MCVSVCACARAEAWRACARGTQGAASRRGPQGQYISPRAPHKVSGPLHAPHACAGDLCIGSAPRRDAWRQQLNACAGGGAWRMRHLPLRALIHKERCVLPMLEHTLVRAHALHCRFMAPRTRVRTQRSKHAHMCSYASHVACDMATSTI